MKEASFLKPSRQYSCMRHNWQIMGCGAQVDSAERRLKPFLTGKVCRRICRAAEKLDMVRMFHRKELTNFRMYRSKD